MCRFVLNNGEESEYFTDKNTGITYWFNEHEDFCYVVDLLNEAYDTRNMNTESDSSVKEDLLKLIDSDLSKYGKHKEEIEQLLDGGHLYDDVSMLTGLAIMSAKYDCLSSLKDKILDL